ncbi:MAG: NAD(P)-binding domain-containing protein [Chloroflexi bacterium]|nr:NAD(P)-binding domain-containing protein [Chloroflexota bacterium]
MSIENVAVIGAGAMGHGIAQVAAMSGQQVSLVATSDASLEKAMQKIRYSLDRLHNKGRIKESPPHVMERVRTTTSLKEAVTIADYVIEAVPEDLNLKKEVLKQADLHAPAHTVLATSTSSLPITILAGATRRKEKVIGTHWMNPPQIMRLIEVIRSRYTDEETMQSTLDLCRRYGKETIVAKKDVWHFLSGRSHSSWLFEANLMYLRKDADAREMDAVARYKIGLPMGPFELFDFLGNVDLRLKTLKSAEELLKIYPEFEPSPVFLALHRYLAKELWALMSEKGMSGVKTGKGFYTYPDRKYVKPEIPLELAEKVEPIQVLAPAINGAAWCVTNGIGSVSDVNKAFRLGYSWPKGIFEYIDELGIDTIIMVLKAKESKAPQWLRDFYRPDPLLTGRT